MIESPAPAPHFVTPTGSVVQVTRYGGGVRQATHAHERTSITMLLRGELEERVGRDVERASCLSVVVKPAGVEHADTYGPAGAVALQLTLSPGDEACAAAAACRLSAWRWMHGSPVARPLLGMLGRLRRAAGRVGETGADPEELLLELLAALPGGEPPQSAAPPWLLRARDALLDEAAPIRDVAADAQVHPVHLAREFRRFLGATPSEIRRRGRVRRAAGLLADSRLDLADAALAAGYADQAHMNREFRAVAGVTPRRLRIASARA